MSSTDAGSFSSPMSDAAAVDRNIAAVHGMRVRSDQLRRADQRFVDHVAAFLGTTRSLYCHLVIYGSWVGLHFWKMDAWGTPAFFSTNTMSFAASLEALFLAVFVLINQRRMNFLDRKNSDLHMQMSLLAEHEVTRLAQVLNLVAKKLAVDTSSIADLDEVVKEVDPRAMLERISYHEKERPTDLTADTPPHRGD